MEQVIKSKKQTLYKNFVYILSGNVSARLILVLGMPLLANYYSPSQIGEWQLFIAVIALIAPILTWKYEVAYVLPESPRIAINLFLGSVLIAIILSIFLSFIFSYASSTIAKALNLTVIDEFIWLIPFVAFLYAMDQCSSFWLTRKSQFIQQIPGRIIQSITMIVLPLLLFIMAHNGFNNLILGSIVAQVAATSIILYFLFRAISSEMNINIDYKIIWSALVEYKNYPLFVTPYGLISQASVRLLIFVLAWYSTVHEVGLFAMSLQLTLIPVTFIGLSLSKVIYPKLAREFNSVETHRQLSLILTLIIGISTPWAVLFIWYSSELLSFVLGNAWADSGYYAAWLTPPSLLLLFTSWLNRVYDVAGKQKLEFIIQLTYSAVLFSSIALAMSITGEIKIAVQLYSIITVMFYFTWLLIAFRIASIAMHFLIKPMLFFLGLLAISVVTIYWISIYMQTEILILVPVLFLSVQVVFVTSYLIKDKKKSRYAIKN